MKSISDLFTEAWEKKENRKWDYVYIMVDLHGVVLPSNYHVENELRFIDECAEWCLQYLSQQEDVILILWTSSHQKEIDRIVSWLNRAGVHFRFINENPLERNTTYADFSKKPYFSILLDDKAGFDPSNDWIELYRWMVSREREKLR